MATSEDLNRLGVTTRTSNGHYDEVLAISQTAINKNFANLFTVYPELQSYSYKDETATYNATFLPPQVIIPAKDGNNNNALYFQLRFATGSIINTDSRPIIEDLSNWIFTVQCEIDRKNIGEPQPDDHQLSPEQLSYEQEKRQRELEAVTATYDVVAGDYSIERLYARLSTAKWGEPVPDFSQAGLGPDGKPVSMTNWMRNNKFNTKGQRLRNFLMNWNDEMQQSNFNTLGLTFKLKDVKSLGNPPTYEPTASSQQVYPYKELRGGQIYYPEDHPDDIVKGNGRNCLLFAEMVQNHPMPLDPWVIWSGNFAPDDTSKDGTFLLSHDIFVRQYLLKQFQGLNQATEIIHKKDEQTFIQKDTGRYGVLYHAPYIVGSNPDHPDPMDEFYAFKPIYMKDSAYKTESYTWTQENGPWTTNIQQFDGCKTKGTVHDINSTTVTWTPGDNKIYIKGCAKTMEHGIWSPNRNSEDWDNPGSELNDLYEVDWTVTVIIKKMEDTDTIKGALTIEVDKNTPCTVDYKPKHIEIEDNGHGDELKGLLQSQIADRIGVIAQNCASRLQGSGRFVYPGNGILSFSNPQFGKWGDLIADITYLPLDPGDFIQIPAPHDPGDQDPGKGQEGGHPVDPPPPPTELLLTWEVTPQVNAGTEDKVIFKATNHKETPLPLDSLKAIFTSGKLGMDLFSAADFTIGDNNGTPESSTTDKKGPPREGDDETSAQLDFSKDIIKTVPKLELRKASAEETKGYFVGQFNAYAAVISHSVETEVFTIPPGGWVTLTLTGPIATTQKNPNVLANELWKFENAPPGEGFAKRFQVKIRKSK